MDNMRKISVTQVTFDKNRIDAGDLKALAANIKQYGLQCPILVIETENNGNQTYKIVDGRRRFEACLLNGMTEIDALVLTESEVQEDLSLILNTYRLNLSPVELYQQAVKFVKNELKGDPVALPPDKINAVAAKLNLDIPATYRILNVGRLDSTVRNLLAQNKLPLRLALLTLKINDAKSCGSFCNFCMTEHPSIKNAVEWMWQKHGSKQRFYEDVDNAIFDTDDCKGCRFLGMRDGSLFEEPGKSNEYRSSCWNPECYAKKENAEWQRFMQDAREKIGLKNIKRAPVGFREWDATAYQSIVPVNKEKCKECKQVVAYVRERVDQKIEILCPDSCANIKKAKRESSRAAKPGLKDRDKLTAIQKKEVLTARFSVAARKVMVEEFLTVTERQSSNFSNTTVRFVKGKEPKDYKRILFFVGLFAGRNPFGWNVLEVNNDGADMRKNPGKEERAHLAIMDNLDLPAVAKLNIDNAASHLNSYDRANTTPEEIDNAIELLYGIKRWSKTNYGAITTKLSKVSKELLAEVKPWKPDWAK